MANRVHKPLKFIAFNAYGFRSQRYELSKQLQDLNIDVALLSETNVKPQERFFIPSYHVYRNDHHPGRKGGTAVADRKGIPHNHVDLPPLITLEATGSAYQLVTEKYCLQLFKNLQAGPGMMQTSMNS
jgi:hypothetical protein